MRCRKFNPSGTAIRKVPQFTQKPDSFGYKSTGHVAAMK
jgi:hypothetical protein